MKHFQTAVIAFAALSTMALPANAINRYNTKKMTCEQVQSTLNRDKAAILRYPSARNQSITLYDRYVRSGYYCEGHTVPERVRIPVKNTDRCPVLHCIPRPDPCDSLFGRLNCGERPRGLVANGGSCCKLLAVVLAFNIVEATKPCRGTTAPETTVHDTTWCVHLRSLRLRLLCPVLWP